jgi:hypothetical protein
MSHEWYVVVFNAYFAEMQSFRILGSGGSIPQVSEPQIVFAGAPGNSTIYAPIMFLTGVALMILHQQACSGNALRASGFWSLIAARISPRIYLCRVR